MFHRNVLIGVMAAVLLFPFSASSQEPQRGLDETATAAVKKKAVDLLKSLAGQVESLRSAENRARIRSNIAGSLWSHDEERARSLFTLVGEDIKAGFNSTDPEDPRRRHTLMVFSQLRRDTIDRIAKHDPLLALQFLRATRPHIDMDWPYQLRDAEKTLELRLATQIAAKNPDLALKLGRASLAKGLSPDLLSVLFRLRSQHKEASAGFYKEIADKLKTVNLAQDSAALNIAVTMARSIRPPEADELIYRDLIGHLLTSALDSGCADAKEDYAAQICYEIGSVVLQMEKYYASRAAPLGRWRSTGHDDPPQEVWDEVRKVIRDGTVNEILALASKYPEMQRQVHWAAVRKAEASGDVAKARQLASEFPDEEQRREMLGQIDRDQMSRSVNAEKLVQIQQGISRMRNNEQRISFLLYMAGQIGASDQKAALGLLNQAGEIIDSGKIGRNLIGLQIQRAMVYCTLKSDRGFTIMEPLIPKLNELVTAAAALDGFENNYLRDGEWNMSAEGTVGAILTSLAQNAGVFAWADFDRAVTLAGQLERPELRLMAHLKIAQGVLENQSKFSMFQLDEGVH